jgi:ABC-type uncharacterized transport system involved in gliding motility auxiliary subunit
MPPTPNDDDRPAPEAAPPAQPSGTRRRAVAASTLGVGVLLAAALLVLVNYFAWKYYHRFDWTSTHLYSLSEKTENVVRSLQQPVDVVVFTSPDAPLGEQAEELLDRYQALSPQLRVRTLDPVKNLSEAQRLLEQYDTRYQQGTVKVVFDSGAARRIFEESDLADYDYSAMQMGGAPTVTGFKGEAVFTGALVDLAAGERPTVLFTTGHGEKKLDDFAGNGLRGMQELLGKDNVQMEEWASLGKPVPEGTSLLVIAGPTSPFVAPETAAFADYLEAGGRMLVLLDPSLGRSGGVQDLGLGEWLGNYGVEVGNDLVIDPDSGLPFFGADTFFVNAYGSHPVTQALAESDTPVILALARSVSVSSDTTPGLERVSLLETGAAGWGETGFDQLPEVSQGDGDRPGPVSLGVAVSKESSEEAADEPDAEGESAKPASGLRMVVFGDSDFAADGQIANAGNAALVDNAVNWLLERETLLGIPPKKPEQVRLNLTGDQLLRVYLLAALLPLLAIIAGVAVFFKRRR